MVAPGREDVHLHQLGQGGPRIGDLVAVAEDAPPDGPPRASGTVPTPGAAIGHRCRHSRTAGTMAARAGAAAHLRLHWARARLAV